MRYAQRATSTPRVRVPAKQIQARQDLRRQSRDLPALLQVGLDDRRRPRNPLERKESRAMPDGTGPRGGGRGPTERPATRAMIQSRNTGARPVRIACSGRVSRPHTEMTTAAAIATRAVGACQGPAGIAPAQNSPINQAIASSTSGLSGLPTRTPRARRMPRRLP